MNLGNIKITLSIIVCICIIFTAAYRQITKRGKSTIPRVERESIKKVKPVGIYPGRTFRQISRSKFERMNKAKRGKK